MKVTKGFFGIRDCMPCNPLIFSPIRVGDYSFRISLRPLRERGVDLIDNLSTHNARLGLSDGISN